MLQTAVSDLEVAVHCADGFFVRVAEAGFLPLNNHIHPIEI